MSLSQTLQERFAASDDAAALVEEIGTYFASRGLLGNEGSRPLYEACVCAAECWKGLRDEEFPPPDRAGVSLPWIGPRYSSHRVAILAINFVAYGGLWANWEIKERELEQLGAGRKKVHDSDFAYAISSYAAITLASYEKRLPETEALPSPQDGALALESCAFLQAVKCAPVRERSVPTDEMTHNCPREYLMHELALLAPKTIIVLGDWPSARLQTLQRTGGWRRTRELERGWMELGDNRVEVLGCYHPGYRGWRRSYRALVPSLREAPLSG